MVRTEKSVGTKTLLTVIQTCLIITATLVPLCWGEEEQDAVSRRCVYVRFLENPYFQDRYRENLSRARVSDDRRSGDTEAMYSNIVRASISSKDGNYLGSLDSFSTGCVACHNGIVSPQETLNFKNNPERRMQMISGKHPIGMDYARYAAASKNLRKPEQLNPGLVLIGGKVSCVTCHDPLNPEKNHLAMNDSGRDLCLECHNL